MGLALAMLFGGGAFADPAVDQVSGTTAEPELFAALIPRGFARVGYSDDVDSGPSCSLRCRRRRAPISPALHRCQRCGQCGRAGIDHPILNVPRATGTSAGRPSACVRGGVRPFIECTRDGRLDGAGAQLEDPFCRPVAVGIAAMIESDRFRVLAGAGSGWRRSGSLHRNRTTGRQGERPAGGPAHVVGKIEVFCHPLRGGGWLSRHLLQRIQRADRHPLFPSRASDHERTGRRLPSAPRPHLGDHSLAGREAPAAASEVAAARAREGHGLIYRHKHGFTLTRFRPPATSSGPHTL
jgi:hypothetical protein